MLFQLFTGLAYGQVGIVIYILYFINELANSFFKILTNVNSGDRRQMKVGVFCFFTHHW